MDFLLLGDGPPSNSDRSVDSISFIFPQPVLNSSNSLFLGIQPLAFYTLLVSMVVLIFFITYWWIKYLLDSPYHHSAYLAERSASSDLIDLDVEHQSEESDTNFDKLFSSSFTKIVVAPQSDVPFISDDLAPYFNFGVDFVTLVGSLRSSKGMEDYQRAFNAFIRPYISPADSINSLVLIVKDAGFGSVSEWCSSMETVETQGVARDCFTIWKQFKNSELVSKFNRVLFGIVSLGLTGISDMRFSLGGLRVFSDKFLSSFAVTTLMDLSERVCELMISFFEVGYECFVTQSLRPLLVSNRECRDWIDTYQKLVQAHSLLSVTENPDYVAMLCDMDTLIEKGEILVRTRDGEYIKSFLRDLLNMKVRFVQKHNVSSRRKSPLAFLIHGPVAIGKTSVTDIIGKVYHRVVTTVPDSTGKIIYPTLNGDFDNAMYTYTGTDKFFSGFKGSQHWMLVMDDIARTKANQVSQGKDDSLNEVISIINTVGYATNQAAVEDKGVIPMLPKLVVGTTNTKNLNAHHAVEDPCAVLRRFPYVIEPIVKPEFRNPGTHTLKTGKVPHADPWIFKIEHAIPVYNGGAGHMQYNPVHGADGSIYSTSADLCKFIQRVTLQHESDARVMQQVLNNNDCCLCSHGVLSTFPCSECDEQVIPYKSLEFQSLSILPYVIPWFCGWIAMESFGLNRLLSKWFQTFKWFVSFGREGCLLWVMWICPSFLRGHLRDFLISCYLCSPDSYYQLLKLHYERHVPRNIITARNVLVGSSAILVMLLAQQLYSRRRRMEPQGEPLDSWVKEEDFFRVPSVTKQGNRQELENRIRKCMVVLDVRDSEGKTQKVMAFHHSSQRYVTVSHAFSGSSPYQCVVRLAKDKFQQSRVCPFILTDDNISFDRNMDTAVFTSASILPRASLERFISTETYNHGGKFTLLKWSSDMDILSKDFKYTAPERYTWEHCKGSFYKGSSMSEPSAVGDCGGLYVTQTCKGYVIVGMHCAGNQFTNSSIAIPLSQSSLSSLLQTNPLDYLEAGDNTYFENGSKRTGRLGEIPDHSVPGWMEPGRCDPIGSFPGRSTHRSHTKETKIAVRLREIKNLKKLYTAPVMNPYFNGDAWINPYTLNANKQNKPSSHFVESEVLLASRQFYEDVVSSMPEIAKTPSIVSMHVAINGEDGSRYRRSLPFSTSGGFHFPGEKRKYFVEDDNGKYSCGPELYSKYKELEEYYSLGRRANVIFSGALKDEAVSLEKSRIGKTRLFTGSDLPFSLMVRKHFLAIVDLMMTHNIPFECAVGMNCHSFDWVKIFMHITAHGEDRMIAGDFASYDKGMCALIMRGVFYFFEKIREHFFLPISAHQRMMCKGICTDICFPVTNINGDVIQFYGGNSSGHPLTVMVNSVANSIYMRLSYHISGHELPTFRFNVSMISLGDDNTMGSRLDSFNHTVISESLAKVGVKYTMADKNSESVPFLHISSIDFLKRGFKKLRNTVCAPLSIDSLIRSITIFTDKENVSEEERLAETIDTFLSEIALHGEEQFREWQDVLLGIVDEDPMILHFANPRMRETWSETLDRVLPHTKYYL